ncbi:MAG: hypothetical protein M3198_01075 [Actinomycetota bacterium]|nr:hypothetical protein [Actinomycetota bacterium]
MSAALACGEVALNTFFVLGFAVLNLEGIAAIATLGSLLFMYTTCVLTA